jgi:hypothetical protein
MVMKRIDGLDGMQKAGFCAEITVLATCYATLWSGWIFMNPWRKTKGGFTPEVIDLLPFPCTVRVDSNQYISITGVATLPHSLDMPESLLEVLSTERMGKHLAFEVATLGRG